MLEKIHDIIHFWFGNHEDDIKEVAERWFIKHPAFDAQIKEQFEDVLKYAGQGKLDVWIKQPLSCLAYIVLCDQFPRNIYRDTAHAFAYDDKAKAATLYAIEHELDKDLNVIQRQFMYMPLMHSEDIEDQNHCVILFQKLVDIAHREQTKYLTLIENAHKYAVMHLEVIQQYKRFPHRNRILGRENTPEEEDYLKRPGSGF